MQHEARKQMHLPGIEPLLMHLVANEVVNHSTTKAYRKFLQWQPPKIISFASLLVLTRSTPNRKTASQSGMPVNVVCQNLRRVVLKQ